MRDYQTISKTYLDKIKKLSQDSDLVNITQELLKDGEPFFNHLDVKKIKLSLAEDRDFPIIEKIVQVAYNWRYSNGTKSTANSFQAIKDAPHTKTLVAKIKLNNKELILGTARLVQSDNLEIFSFFTLPKDCLWPHQEKKLIPYEVERLAFHPLLDLENDLSFKMQILQKMFHFLQSLIKKPQQSWLGVTMRENVHHFVTAAGIDSQLIPHTKFVHNKMTKKFMKIHPRYFTEIAAYEIKIEQ
ncbi:MAG: hypothetical protein Q4G02_00095 [bacterium]|nr:hypothetical protein [bacterium]